MTRPLPLGFGAGGAHAVVVMTQFIIMANVHGLYQVLIGQPQLRPHGAYVDPVVDALVYRPLLQSQQDRDTKAFLPLRCSLATGQVHSVVAAANVWAAGCDDGAVVAAGPESGAAQSAGLEGGAAGTAGYDVRVRAQKLGAAPVPCVNVAPAAVEGQRVRVNLRVTGSWVPVATRWVHTEGVHVGIKVLDTMPLLVDRVPDAGVRACDAPPCVPLAAGAVLSMPAMCNWGLDDDDDDEVSCDDPVLRLPAVCNWG